MMTIVYGVVMEATTTTKSPKAIDAEIEAAKARIRRLRLERKSALLADAEAELLRRASEPDDAHASEEGGDHATV